MLAAFEQNEIDLARQALDRHLGGDAENFARAMLQDHERALADVQQHSPAASEQSAALRARGQARVASVGMEEDLNAYRNAFLKATVADYSDALKLMDAQWLPVAKGEQTRAYLAGARKRLAHAYERAQAVVSTR